MMHWHTQALWWRLLLFSLLLLALKVIGYLAAVASEGLLLCLFALLWLPLAGVLFWRARVRRGVLLRAYLHDGSAWMARLRGGALMLCWQALLALPLALVLLVVISQTGSGRVWTLMLVAVPAWIIAEWVVMRWFAGQINPRLLNYGAGALVLYFLVGLLSLFWAVSELWAEFDDVSAFTLMQAWRFGAATAVGESVWLVTLASWWNGVDAVRLWLVQQVAQNWAHSYVVALAWMLALLQGALFIVPLLMLLQGASVLVDRLLTAKPAYGIRIKMLAVPVALLVAWTLLAANPYGWLRGDRLTIEIGQQRFDVPERALDGILISNADWLKGESQAAFIELYAHAEDELAQVFQWARGRVPVYADWHYSMAGSASRTGLGLMAALTGDDSQVLESIQEKLFPDGEWERRRERFDASMRQSYASSLYQLQHDMVDDLQHRLAPWRAHPHHRAADLEIVRLDLDGVDFPDLMRTDTAMRQSAASLALGGAAALSLSHAVRRAAAARAAAQTSARVSARAGARAAGGASAVAAGTVCAPGGAAALVCALGAFVVTTVSAEYVIVKSDEVLSRARLEAELLAALDKLEQDTLVTLSSTMLVALKQDVESLHIHTFSKIRPIDQIPSM